jgi:hypothetical protein
MTNNGFFYLYEKVGILECSLMINGYIIHTDDG